MASMQPISNPQVSGSPPSSAVTAAQKIDVYDFNEGEDEVKAAVKPRFGGKFSRNRLTLAIANPQPTKPTANNVMPASVDSERDVVQNRTVERMETQPVEYFTGVHNNKELKLEDFQCEGQPVKKVGAQPDFCKSFRLDSAPSFHEHFNTGKRSALDVDCFGSPAVKQSKVLDTFVNGLVPVPYSAVDSVPVLRDLLQSDTRHIQRSVQVRRQSEVDARSRPKPRSDLLPSESSQSTSFPTPVKMEYAVLPSIAGLVDIFGSCETGGSLPGMSTWTNTKQDLSFPAAPILSNTSSFSVPKTAGQAKTIQECIRDWERFANCYTNNDWNKLAPTGITHGKRKLPPFITVEGRDLTQAGSSQFSTTSENGMSTKWNAKLHEVNEPVMDFNVSRNQMNGGIVLYNGNFVKSANDHGSRSSSVSRNTASWNKGVQAGQNSLPQVTGLQSDMQQSSLCQPKYQHTVASPRTSVIDVNNLLMRGPGSVMAARSQICVERELRHSDSVSEQISLPGRTSIPIRTSIPVQTSLTGQQPSSSPIQQPSMQSTPNGATNSQDDLYGRLRNNMLEEIPQCHCLDSYDESSEGPYYTHLGVGPSVAAIRQIMEQRLELKGDALRIEKIIYTGKEGKSAQGCPIAKWIIRRSGPHEKALVLTRQRRGHTCNHAVMVIAICLWDGIPQECATELYDYLTKLLPENGEPTERRCGWNEQKTCACQGWNDLTGGASFSFGCSWSMYYNACKFARSDTPRKFRLKDQSQEPTLEHYLQSLATYVAPIYQRTAPDSYRNQVQFEAESPSCRLGYNPGRPWSGITAVVDFCTHAHKDNNNMNNGCTTIVTLTKHRGHGRPDDEQLHVLPLCIVDSTDEFGDLEAQQRKVRDGNIEFLSSYPTTVRLHRTPVICKAKRIRLAAQARRAAGIVYQRGRGGGVKTALGVAAAGALRVAHETLLSQYKAGLSRGRGRGVVRGRGAAGFPRHVITRPDGVKVRQLQDGQWVPVKARGRPRTVRGGEIRSECLHSRQSFDTQSVSSVCTDDNVYRSTSRSETPSTFPFSSPHQNYIHDDHQYGNRYHPLASPLPSGQTHDLQSVYTGTLFSGEQPVLSLKAPPPYSPGALSTSGSNLNNSLHYPLQYPRLDAYNLQSSYRRLLESTHYGEPLDVSFRGQHLTNHLPYSSHSVQSPYRLPPYVSSEQHIWLNGTAQPPYSLAPYNSSAVKSPDIPYSHTNNNSPFIYRPPNSSAQSDLFSSRPSPALESPPVDNRFRIPGMERSRSVDGQPQLSGSHCFASDSFIGSQVTHNLCPPFSNVADVQTRVLEQHARPVSRNVVDNDRISTPDRTGSLPRQLSVPDRDGFRRPPSISSLTSDRTVCSSAAYLASLPRVDSLRQPPDRPFSTVPVPMSHMINPVSIARPTSVNIPQSSGLPDHLTQSDTQCINFPFRSALDILSDTALSDSNIQLQNGMRAAGPMSSTMENGLTSPASNDSMPQGSLLKEEPIEMFSDNVENFKDSTVGGVAIAVTHGSILFEVAKRELHATTALKNPSRSEPTRISLVFYQHKNLHFTNHGRQEYERRYAERQASRAATEAASKMSVGVEMRPSETSESHQETVGGNPPQREWTELTEETHASVPGVVEPGSGQWLASGVTPDNFSHFTNYSQQEYERLCAAEHQAGRAATKAARQMSVGVEVRSSETCKRQQKMALGNPPQRAWTELTDEIHASVPGVVEHGNGQWMPSGATPNDISQFTSVNDNNNWSSVPLPPAGTWQ